MDLIERAKMYSKQNTPVYKKLFSLLSVVRVYNVIVVFIAQLLSAIFIFSPHQSTKTTLKDHKLWSIILATTFVIASGYIINHFYDKGKDAINRPIKTKIDSFISQGFKLKVYFVLNLLSFALGFIVSWRAALFFAVYIFAIWLYSHKLKRYPLVGLLGGATLSILPFFAVFAYYKNLTDIIFIHAAFLFFLLIIKDLIKGLENLKGDMLFNYRTIVTQYGEFFTKLLISLVFVLCIIPVIFILKYPEIGYMKYYFIFAVLGLSGFEVLLWFSYTKKRYVTLHNIIRLIIVLGIFSLTLIDTSILINRILNKIII